MKAKIEFVDDEDDNVSNLMIKLFVIHYDNYPKHLHKTIDTFISSLCGLIGAKTDVNYHAYTGATNGEVYISLHVYNEKVNTTLELAQTRLNTVVKYLENLDLTHEQSYITKLLNILIHNDINIDDFLYASVVNRANESVYIDAVPIRMKHPTKYKRIKVKRVNFDDGSTITFISDKCATNYGIFINLSVPFSEMNMSYNALHLYEHLMMQCFYNIPEQELDDNNGSTYPNGLCFVYTTHKTLLSLKAYLNHAIKELFDTRDVDYWKREDTAARIAFETKRTISETRHTRTMIDFGRSDLHAYTNGYDSNIFSYWSNKPFDVIVTGQNIKPDIIDLTKINKYALKHPINNVPKPNIVHYNTIPIDVLMNKEFSATIVKKCDKEYIKDLFSHSYKNTEQNTQEFLNNGLIDYGPYGYLYGMDCKIISLRESMASYNTYMMPIVFYNKMYTPQELEHVLNATNVPVSANNYATMKYFNS